MKPPFYYKKSDADTYLLDRVRFNVFRTFYAEDCDLSRIKFNDEGVAKLHFWLPEGIPQVAMLRRKKKGLIILSHWFNFNFNRTLRKHFKKKLKMPRINGTADEEDDNVLPIQLRNELAKRGYTFSRIRAIGYRIFLNYLQVVQFSIGQALEKELGIKKDNLGLRASLADIEICNDMIVPVGEELPAKKRIRQNFSHHVPLVDKHCWGWKKKPYLFGLYGKNHSEKLYFKQSSTDGVICRAERFMGKMALKKFISKRSFSSSVELEGIVTQLAPIAHENWFKIYGLPSLFSKKRKWHILKAALRENFKHRSDEVLKRIKAVNCIHTGAKQGSVSKEVRKITLRLAREGKLFRKRKAGVYEIDWVWLLKTKDSLKEQSKKR
jgi:hypothetical protein